MTTKLLFLGDVYSEQGLPINWLSNKLKQVFSTHDLISCNLEGPTTSNSTPASKIGPSISQPPTVLKYCISSGINLFNLANNHLMDYAEAGLRSTLKEIARTKAHYVGVGYAPLTIKLKDLTISYVSGCEHEFGVFPSIEPSIGVAWINDPEIDLNIIQAKARGHFVIVQPHAGEESPLPLPEWRSRYRHFIDLGADIVIGHHSHSPQGWERYRHKTIYYSLGNFFFKNSSISSSNSGYAVSLSISQDHHYSVKVIPVSRNHDIVDFDPKLIALFRDRSKAIVSKDYLAASNAQALSLWDHYYARYFRSSMSHNPIAMLRKKDLNYLMILHNIRIESHRMTIIRALEQL